MFSKLTFIGMNIVLEAALLAVSATESDFNLNLHHTANTRPKLKQAHSSLTFFFTIYPFFFTLRLVYLSEIAQLFLQDRMNPSKRVLLN